MKRIANLYLPELEPNRDWLTLNRATGSVATVLIAVVFTTIFLNWFGSRADARLEDLRSQLQNREQSLQGKQAQLQAALNDTGLQTQIEQTRAQVVRQQRLLSQMQQMVMTADVSFSQLLTDLARVDKPAIWLQRIQMEAGDLTLQGHTLSAETLPQWLASFGQYKALQARQFSVFELTEGSKPQGLSFTVGSAHATAPTSQGAP